MTKQSHLWTLVILCLLAATTLAHARHDGAYLHEVTTKLTTPHFDWATPYAQGKPKVLFITPRTLAPREIVELWQRFDLDFEAVTMAHSGLMSFESNAGAAPYDLAVEGTSIEEKTDELVRKLETRYDAIVLANARLDVLPKEVQYKILKQVSDGAGLLFTFTRNTSLPIFKKPLADGREIIWRGVPLTGLGIFKDEKARTALKVQQDADLPEKIVETFAFGQGRIAVLNYGVASGTYYGGHGLTPPQPWSLNWPADYEYLLSLVYKALLWTTKSHQPRVIFTELPLQAIERTRDTLPAGMNVTITSAAALDGKLTVIVRDHTNIIESQREMPVKLSAGDNAIPVSIPRVKSGEHFLDLIYRTAGGTEAWGSVFVKVTSPLALAGFGTSTEFAEKGTQPVLAATLTAPAPAQTHLLVTLTDGNDRCYARRDIAFTTGDTELKPVKLDLSGATTIATRLRADLLVGSDVMDSRDSFIFVPRRENDTFRSIIWGLGGNGGLTWLGMQQLRAAGFTDHLSHPSPDGSGERLMALHDQPLVCYAYRIMGHADDKGWRKDGWIKDVEDACFYNPELQQKARDSVIGRINPVIAYGPSLYSLGDENHFDYKTGFSPAGKAAFHSYLRKQYRDLSALNSSWGTDYKSWEELQLLSKEEALKQNLWPLIHEHMSLNEQEYADYHHYLRDEIRKADPGAWVGAEGSIPGDLEKTIGGMEIWGPYADKRGNELLRSLSTPDLVRGNWWGGYVGSHGGRVGATLLWNQLISGAVNTSLYFATTGAEGLLSADMSYAKYFADMLPELREIYGGIGQLIAASTVADDAIAIHWSQANEHGATLFAGVGSPVSSQGNLLGLLDRNGFGYRFVTTKMIESGDLSKYRVLFLACSQALSDAEATAIGSFVEAGGTLIADVGTGNMNGDCRPLWKSGGEDLAEWRGSLDGLLGLTRKGVPTSRSASASQSFDLNGSRLTLNDFPFRADASVVAQGAAALDGAPLFITRTQGKGRVIFLNFPFPNPEHPDAPAFLQGLMAANNLSPQAFLTNSRGHFMRRFTNGAMTLIGTSREAATTPDTTLKLAKPTYVYDLRAGKLLGKTDTIALPKTAPANRVFALLPAPAEAPAIEVPPAATRGQASTVTVKFAKAGAAPAGRILRIQAITPGGEEATAYRAYPTLKQDSTTISIPWALNDSTGQWSIRATDVATGLAGSAKITLR